MHGAWVGCGMWRAGHGQWSSRGDSSEGCWIGAVWVVRVDGWIVCGRMGWLYAGADRGSGCDGCR